MVQITQKIQRQTIAPWFMKPGTDHVAQFYEDEIDLVRCVLEYIHAGLIRQETCIVIATPSKLIALQKALRKRGVDLAEALQNGWYVTFDAEELLSAFMDDREIDDSSFEESIGALVAHVSSSGRGVRIFGEMAALLRQQRNIHALVALEERLTRLLQSHAFSLYCAYPQPADSERYTEMRDTVVAMHAHTFVC